MLSLHAGFIMVNVVFLQNFGALREQFSQWKLYRQWTSLASSVFSCRNLITWEIFVRWWLNGLKLNLLVPQIYFKIYLFYIQIFIIWALNCEDLGVRWLSFSSSRRSMLEFPFCYFLEDMGKFPMDHTKIILDHTMLPYSSPRSPSTLHLLLRSRRSSFVIIALFLSLVETFHITVLQVDGKIPARTAKMSRAYSRLKPITLIYLWQAWDIIPFGSRKL